jgi:hypothetical protein
MNTRPGETAFQSWLESDAGRECNDILSLGATPNEQAYLENRLRAAFKAGATWFMSLAVSVVTL